MRSSFGLVAAVDQILCRAGRLTFDASPHPPQVVFWVACVISARSIVGLVVVNFAPAFNFVTSNLDIYFR